MIKKTGDWRLCIDYRALNRVTKNEAYRMPLVDDMLNSVGQSSWFCLIDLKSAYWQIPMEESSICETVFSTQKGHYEFTRMPFGLSFAAFTFQNQADEVLRDVADICKAYLDDLLCHGGTFEECCERLHRVLKILIEARLLASFSKCQFLQQEMPYLGFLLTKDGVKIDPAKIEAIRSLKPPTDVAGLQHVLGLFQHYARFYPQFAGLAVPLTDLLQKGRTWYYWSSSCHSAFEGIKQVLTSEPVLIRPDFAKPFIVQTDWSPTALGAILAQELEHEDGSKYEAVVFFASKKLKGAELHYSATEGECQAVLWAVKLFRPYIYGALFELQTEHFALKWLMTCKDLQGKLARWSLKLQAYNMVTVHKKGRVLRNVDALSRMDTTAAHYLALALADERENSLDNSDESSWESDSEDGLADMTEAEGLEFLAERDKFLNDSHVLLFYLKKILKRSTGVTKAMYYLPGAMLARGYTSAVYLCH